MQFCQVNKENCLLHVHILPIYSEHEFVNVHFIPGELKHGSRYMFCIHVNASKIEHEFWDEELEEIDECSNGITVDLTPPVTADVWIGNRKEELFQVIH